MEIQAEQLISYIGEKNLKISCLITAAEKELLQKLLGDMSDLFGVATALSDPDGTPVLEYCNFTELCQKHIRGSEEGLRRCKQEAFKRGKVAEESGEPQVYKCHAGIVDFTSPIILLNRRIGNISGGQLFVNKPDDEMRAHFEKYLDEIGVKDKAGAMQSLELQYIKDKPNISKVAAVYFRIGKLLSNYFHFQAEYGFWKDSLLKMNEELEQRVSLRTIQLEEKMTELKNTQMRLIQQEKLAGIGQLAAGVAHEVNNPLGFIISNLGTLDKYVNKFTEMLTAYQELKDIATIGNHQNLMTQIDQIEKIATQKKLDFIKGDAGELLKETQSGLIRIAEIVQSLRVFSRVDASSDLEDYDLNAGVENTLLIALNDYQDYADVEKKLGDIPLFKCAGNEVNQVLLGIIVNAAQAIKDKKQGVKGTISISTYCDNDFIFFEVKDNGVGMSAQVVNRVFEPFFTTKPPGKNTGLGLSVAHDIVVNKMKGEILVESEEGDCSKIVVKFPISTAG